MRVRLEFSADGLPATLGQVRTLQQGLAALNGQRVEAGQFVAVQQALRLTANEADQLAQSLNFPEAGQAIAQFQSMRTAGTSLEQAFVKLSSTLGLSRQQFDQLAQGFAAIQRVKIDNVLGLARSLGLTFTQAQRLAQQMGLTSQQANAAIQRMGQLRAASATSGQQFKILQTELGITRQQFDQLSAAADRAKKGVDGVKPSGNSIGTAFAGLSGIAFGFNNILQSVMSLKEALTPAYDLLIGQNERLNQEILKSQANIAANTRVFQDGIEVTDVSAKIDATRGALDAAIKQIQEDTMSLVGVTSSEVSTVFQILLTNTKALQNQSKEFPDAISAAVSQTKGWVATLGTLGMPLALARQEINSVLQGTIDQNSVLAKSLGITNQQVREWKAQGILVDELNKKFETYVVANAKAADTITGMSSNIKDIFQLIGRTAGEPLMEPLVAAVREFYEWLTKNRDAIESFSQGAMEQFLEWGSVISDHVLGALEALVPPLQVFYQEAVKIAEGFFPITKNIYALVEELARILAPILSLVFKLYGFLQSLILPVIKMITDGVLLLAKSLRFGVEFVEKIVTAIAKLPIGVIKKMFGGSDEAADGVQNVTDKVNELGDAAGDVDGLEIKPKDLQELGTAFEQLEGKASQAMSTLESGAGGDLNAAKAAAKELMSITDEQLRLGQITEEEAIARLKKIAENTKLTYEEQLAAQEKIAALQEKALDRQAQKAIDTAKLAATERENATKQALLNGEISEREANEASLQIARERIDAELAAEQEKLAALEALPAASGEAAIEREKKIQDAKQKTADLTGQLLDNELAQQKALEARIIQGIKDRTAELQRQSEMAISAVNAEIAANERLAKTLEMQKALMTAKADLAQAQSDLAQSRMEIEISRTERAMELQQQLADESLKDSELRLALEKELSALGIRNSDDAVKLLQQKQKLEDNLAKEKLAALERQQEQERAALEIQIRQNQLAAERGVLQAKVNKLQAEFAQIQAQQALAEAQALNDKEARERAIKAAQHQIELAQQGIELANESLSLAEQEALAQQELAELERQTLATQQQQTLEEAEAEEAARQAAQRIAVAQAQAEKRRQEEERRLKVLLDQIAAEQQLLNLANAGLQIQVASAEQMERNLAQQSAMAAAQQAAIKAQSDAAISAGESEITRLNKALDIRKKLADTDDPAERAALEEQLNAIRVKGRDDEFADEIKLLEARQEQENQLAENKRNAMIAEQEAQAAALEMDIKRREIAADRAVIEAQMAANTAELGILEAKAKLAQARADGDEAAVQAAQEMLGIAQQQADLAGQNVSFAQQQREELRAIAEQERQTLKVQQQSARDSFDAADKLRLADQGFEMAQAKIERDRPPESPESPNPPQPPSNPNREMQQGFENLQSAMSQDIKGMAQTCEQQQRGGLSSRPQQRLGANGCSGSSNKDVVGAIGNLRGDLRSLTAATANSGGSITNNYIGGGGQAGFSSNQLRNSMARRAGV